MSLIKAIGLLLIPATLADDTTAIRVYYRDVSHTDSPEPLTHADNSLDVSIDDLQPYTDDGSDGSSILAINLDDIDENFVQVPADGHVLFGVAQVDDNGNVSDITSAGIVPFDVEAPPALEWARYVASSSES